MRRSFASSRPSSRGPVESAADNAEAKPLGRILAEERERQGLSRTEVAQRLHMSASQIEAIEGGEYARLPQGPFLRGFIRNYGKLLGLDADGLLSQLAQVAPRNRAPDIVVPSQNIRFDPLGERLASPYVKAGVLAVVAVAMAFAAMYWWLFIRPTQPATQPKQAAGNPVAETPRGGPPQQIAAAPIAAPDPVPPSPAPTMPESAEPAKAEPPKAPLQAARADAAKADAAKADAARKAGLRTLKLRFRADSWVEVRDAQGTVLFSRLNVRGSEAEVAGRPPLSVVVGNAPEVDATYEGRDFPLEPHTKVAVARFTLE
jgi:cytoskeleton protein RodZ